MTDQYAVIGNPIAQSKSPLIHATFAELTGQDMVYDKIEAALGGFSAAVDAFRAAGGLGLNITAPTSKTGSSLCHRPVHRPACSVKTQ